MQRRQPDGRLVYEDDDRVYGEAPPDDRTRVVRGTARRDVEDTTVVNVDQPAYSVVHEEPSTNYLAVRKAQQAVWYFFGIIETLLALRFILLAVGANPANPFFNFVAGITNPLVAPFANLVQTPRLGSSVLELGTVFAMLIYLLLGIAISKLLELFLTNGRSR